MTSSKELIQFLKTSEGKNLKGLSRLKTIYRPFICPFDQLLDQIPKRSAVFDLGCGSGSLLSLINHFRDPAKLGGIEITNQLVENARLLLSSANIPVSINPYDGVSIPEEIGEYNVVTMIDVFHHIPPSIQTDFFSQLYRKMGNNSILIFKDIDASSPFVYANKLHDMLLAGEIGNEWKAGAITKKMEEVGFKCSKTEYKHMIVYPHYTIVARKQ
jgi:2-polyprenyl-3-methyl-5-hydroxy-6-metoxy-1,4-benzoquinol methylase